MLLLGAALIFVGQRQNNQQYSEAVDRLVEHVRKASEPLPTGPSKPEIQEGESKERIFVPANLTPERLLSFYEGNTTIQAAELTNRYVGQWMPISGTVGDISAFSGYTSQLSLQKNFTEPRTWFDYASIYCAFRAPHYEPLRTMKQGDKVSLIGQISRIDPLMLNLDNCELVDPAAKPGMP